MRTTFWRTLLLREGLAHSVVGNSQRSLVYWVDGHLDAIALRCGAFDWGAPDFARSDCRRRLCSGLIATAGTNYRVRALDPNMGRVRWTTALPRAASIKWITPHRQPWLATAHSWSPTRTALTIGTRDPGPGAGRGTSPWGRRGHLGVTQVAPIS